jgi:hypothetical protein
MKTTTQAAATTSATGVLHSNVVVIEVADKVTLDILLADAQTKQLIANRLSDCVAVAAPMQANALLARLRKLGHMPRVLET